MSQALSNPTIPAILHLTAVCQIAPAPLAAEASAGAAPQDVQAAGADGQPVAAGTSQSTLPRFRMVAYTGGAMQVAGWRYPVIIDLAGLAIPSQSRPIRFGHDAGSGVGHTQAIGIESGKLIASGVVSRDTAAAREIVVSSKNGFPWQASVGASVNEFEFVKEGQSVLVNGQSFRGPVNVVRKSTLGEISFVDLGADGNTSAQVAAKAPESQQEQSMTRSAAVAFSPVAPANSASAGSSPETTAPAGMQQSAVAEGAAVTRPATTAVSAQVEAAAPPAPGVPGAPGGRANPVAASASGVAVPPNADDPVAVLRAQTAAELRRIAAIRKMCQGSGNGQSNAGVEAQAIEEGWDETRCELELLRTSRPRFPGAGAGAGMLPGAGAGPGAMVFGAGSREGDAVTGLVLEAACALSARLNDLDRHYDEQTLDLASRRFRGGIGLQELLLEAAWANGYTGRNFREARAILRCAFARPGDGVQAGFSLIDIGGILSNVANKFLLAGFFSVERTWRNICAVRNVTDFKTVTSYRLIGADQYEKVAPGGEIKHGTLGNESYSNRADTYGLLLGIDRRDIINDDLGAITTAPRKLGRGSGLKINDVFWTNFLNHGAFFTAAANNLLTGADTNLSIDGLTKAEVAFLDQTDSDGKPTGIMPAIVLVPTALSALGTQLHKSLELRDNSSGGGGKFPIANPHQGKFRVEVSRYLGNAKYAGSSAKAWYLLAEPTDLPTIEVAFLNGNEAPTIETADADFNVLGVQMRGYHDFGVALQDPRGAVKSKGEA